MGARLVNPQTGTTITLKDGDNESAYRMQGWYTDPTPTLENASQVPVGDPSHEGGSPTDSEVPTDLGPETVAEAPVETHENQEPSDGPH